MTWTAYFQADGEHRHTIAVRRLKHTAEFEVEKFVARMTNPEVGVWWTWVEETNEEPVDGPDNSDPAVRDRLPERNDSEPAAIDPRDGV